MDEFDLILGIDLGTTFSAVAKWERGTAVMVQNATGHYTTQSVVYIQKPENGQPNGQPLVGDTAYRLTCRSPDRGIIGVKREMDDGNQNLTLGGEVKTPIEISAEILMRLIADTTRQIPGSQPICTVVTVPYYFKAHQVANTRQAAEMAGVACRAILQEPIAASLEYAWTLAQRYPDGIEETILVFDLGGGTFDLTLFSLKIAPKTMTFEVLATGGDDRLGGLDFDHEMGNVLLTKLNPPLTMEALEGPKLGRAKAEILEKAREAKHELSVDRAVSTDVVIAEAVPGGGVEVTVTRPEFEQGIQRYLDKIEAIVSNLMMQAESPKVGRVVLVGGSSKIPAIKNFLRNTFGRDKVHEMAEMDFAVAKGAALYAAYLDDPSILGRKIEIVTRSSHNLGVGVANDLFQVLIPANTPAPKRVTKTFTRDPNTTKLDVKVYQGSKKLAAENSHVGTVKMRGLQSKPMKASDVIVTFTVSNEQRLNVQIEVDGTTWEEELKL